MVYMPRDQYHVRTATRGQATSVSSDQFALVSKKAAWRCRGSMGRKAYGGSWAIRLEVRKTCTLACTLRITKNATLRDPVRAEPATPERKVNCWQQIVSSDANTLGVGALKPASCMRKGYARAF